MGKKYNWWNDMMVRAIYILCEGKTEREFTNSILRPYFHRFNIYDIRAIEMNTSKGQKGGDVKYQRLKYHIDKLLDREADIIVTSLIDFYRLKADFPQFNEAKKIIDKLQRVQFLENALNEAINRDRFIPYIQLHEFEGLLFAAKDGFEFLPNISDANLFKLLEIVEKMENPELLNDGELTAPSKRLEKFITPKYDKTFHGIMIAEVNTIEPLLKKCTRFKNWLDILINATKKL